MRKPAVVWIARLLLGATFMLSGVTKMIDPIGSMTKIEAYLSAWGIADLFGPGIALMGGCALALLEFITGFLLATGSLRRTSAIVATAIMAFMLPLTAYIALANPVDDCGCFGDFLILSNTATFWKNVVLMALAIYLLFNNQRAGNIFAPWVQWMQIAVACLYMIVLAVAGYHEQPLLDFRPYPAGEPLIDADGANLAYIYADSRGNHREFSPDSLPDDDSGWEFVDIKTLQSSSGKMFELFDRFTGDDVSHQVLASGSDRLLILIPNVSAATAGGSYTANELHDFMDQHYGPEAFVAVTEADSLRLERALDLMMATYPVYLADSKAIKTVARGDLALVYLRNDTVCWKRTLSSINLDLLTPDADPAQVYATNGPRIFRLLTFIALLLEIAIAWLGTLSSLARRLKLLH